MFFRSFRLPTQLPAHHPAQRWVAAVVIAFAATGLGLLARLGPGLRGPMGKLDDLLYDSVYKLRPAADQTNGPVVLLAIDKQSLKEINGGALGQKFGWPWPRDTWAMLIPYLESCGAKGVVLDLTFYEQSAYNSTRDDDKELARAAGEAKIPVVFAANVQPDGKSEDFAPPLANPTFGATNYAADLVEREYTPMFRGVPSLGLRAARALNPAAAPDASEVPFRLYYYGPHQRPGGQTTFLYLSASRAIEAAVDTAQHGKPSQSYGFDPEVFRGKVVLVGGLAQSLEDLKASPLAEQYPGVEVHATAAVNLLNGQFVQTIGIGAAAAITLAATFLAALGVVLPRSAWLKLAAAAGTAAVLTAAAVLLFSRAHIVWLPMATPAIALLLATLAAFAWSYFAEDRARQVLFRALSQNLSPELAAKVAANPELLNRLGGERREMTVMFTDVAGFTDISERLEVERLTALMNFYLEEMSFVVMQDQAYLDKYIGDAIMGFWNGVIDQADHAILACRAALDLSRREQRIQPQLRELGAEEPLFTRVGINTGPMSMGNMGSSLKFAFTVLGDAVNLGSRLEGANKIYGSQILIAKTTADRVRDKFVVRQLDLLRVQGKKQPMAVFELMAAAPGDPPLLRRVERYEAALRSYQQQKWDDAEAILRELLEEFPADTPAAELLKRVKELRVDPPAPDWDGVYIAKGK